MYVMTFGIVNLDARLPTRNQYASQGPARGQLNQDIP